MPTSARWEMSVFGADVGIGPYDDVLYYPRKQQFISQRRINMLFDTHAHMDDRAFDEDRQALLASLEGAGVGLVMNPGCSLESSRDIVQMAEKYPWLYASVGSHPDSASEVNEEVLEEYRKLCKLSDKMCGIVSFYTPIYCKFVTFVYIKYLFVI